MRTPLWATARNGRGTMRAKRSASPPFPGITAFPSANTGSPGVLVLTTKPPAGILPAARGIAAVDFCNAAFADLMDNCVSIRQYRLARRAGAGRQPPRRHTARSARHRRRNLCIAAFADLCCTAMGEFGTPGRHYFHTGGGERGRRAYIFAADNRAAIERPLAAPVCLRAHPDEAYACGTLKKALDARFFTTGGLLRRKDAFTGIGKTRAGMAPEKRK